MTAQLTDDDRRALRATVRDLVGRHSTEADVRATMARADGVDERLWRRLVELGLAGVLVPEELGGAGGAMADLGVVMAETGRVLACVPLLSGVHATAVLLRAIDRLAPDSAEAAIARETVSGIADGTLRCAVATLVREPAGAVRRGTGSSWLVRGEARLVLDGDTASHLLVTAEDPDGGGIFIVPADHPSVARRPVGTLDQTRRLADIRLLDAPARRVLGGPAGQAVLLAAEEVAATALAFEQVGGADAVLDMAVGYARSRVQFGRPIGSFQAVKHRCADMLTRVELARTAAMNAAALLDAPSVPAAERSTAVELARAYCADAFYSCAGACLQVHGGIGFTWEHSAHLYLKRAKSGQYLFGQAERSRRRLAGHLGLR